VPSSQTLKTLTVCFRDESIPRIEVKLSRLLFGPYSKTLPVRLPDGSEVEVYVEVFDPESTPDVSLYVTEGEEELCGLRCTSGVVLTCVTSGGYELIIQVGSGPWE
jgi:hypothetical protein